MRVNSVQIGSRGWSTTKEDEEEEKGQIDDVRRKRGRAKG